MLRNKTCCVSHFLAPIKRMLIKYKEMGGRELKVFLLSEREIRGQKTPITVTSWSPPFLEGDLALQLLVLPSHTLIKFMKFSLIKKSIMHSLYNWYYHRSCVKIFLWCVFFSGWLVFMNNSWATLPSKRGIWFLSYSTLQINPVEFTRGLQEVSEAELFYLGWFMIIFKAPPWLYFAQGNLL